MDTKKQEKNPNNNVCITMDGLVELYRIAYNDGFANIGDEKLITTWRKKQINKILKKYSC